MPASSHPPIRSFVLRQGRVSNAQRRAVDTLLSVHGIDWKSHGKLIAQRPSAQRFDADRKADQERAVAAAKAG